MALASSRRRYMEINSWRVGLISILNSPGLDWELVIFKYATERFESRFDPYAALLLHRYLCFVAISGKKAKRANDAELYRQ